ncbi:PTS sugar transporter subunit IIC [Lapidilactobacillus bayanensis]|uniref:PTS sugar transporter subunit IIC n=1 Tax=Lapidilactobacillus bayanensis TaxID=2485998 RepID=UPI000F7AA971|nr:PTS sugar transporter subunit IIC [Lapidilactobacillus bayanensis]
MQKLMDWLEKFVVPVAVKIGSIRWLVALRDGFISTLPITMAGSLATLLNALLNTYPAQWGWTGFINAVAPIVAIDGLVYNGSLAIFALYFAVMWGYHLAADYDTDGLSGALVSVAAFFMTINSNAVLPIAKALPKAAADTLTTAGATVTGSTVSVAGAFSMANMNSASLFTAMIFGGIAVVIYIWLMKKDITIKMPDSVPPAVSKAFTALIPSIAAVYIVAIINYLFTQVTGQFFGDWLSKTIQAPLIGAGQSAGMVLLVSLLVQIFWFFGIHGPNVLGPVLEGIWTPAQLANIQSLKDGTPFKYFWTRGSFDAYVWFGGSGGTIVLLLAILLFSKRADEKTVAKLAFAPGLFNINEPVMFGLPIVLNAIYFVPFIIAPFINTVIAYVVSSLGWVAPVQVAVPWITPPVLNAWMATNFDWRAALLAIVNMVIAFFIWVPFVRMSSKVAAETDDTTAA